MLQETIKEQFPGDELMMKKFNQIKQLNENAYSANSNSKFSTQRAGFKNTNNEDKPSDNKKNSRYRINETPIMINDQKEEIKTNSNFYSTQGKFFSKKKDDTEKSKKSKNENYAFSLNSTVGILENFENRLEKNKLNKLDLPDSKFYKTENLLNKHISPKNTRVTFKQDIRNNLDKFLLDPKKKSVILDNKGNINEKLLKTMSNKKVGNTTKSLVDMNNSKIKFPYQNNLNKYVGRQGNSPSKSNDLNSIYNKNMININNKIPNVDIKGENTEGENEKAKKLTEEEIAERVNQYKTKLNTHLVNMINEEKNKERERMSRYEFLDNEQDKKELEREITRERVFSSEKLLKMNE